MKIIYLSILAVCFSTLIQGFAKNPKKLPLTINASGFESDKGQAILKIFKKEQNLQSKPFRVVIASIKNKKCTFSISNIDWGEYAFVIIHDENKNGKTDHFWSGRESLGFSNNLKISWWSIPSFNELKITYSPSGEIINRRVNLSGSDPVLLEGRALVVDNITGSVTRYYFFMGRSW